MFTEEKKRDGVTAAARNSGSAILARNVSKVYRIYDKPSHRLWDLVLPGGPRGREFWAVRNVYVDIPQGGTVGIIGENGAGKSTLLKLFSGITSPTAGEIQVNGRIASLLELGAGFHPDFSGRENIYLNCSILGMNEEEDGGALSVDRRLLGARRLHRPTRQELQLGYAGAPRLCRRFQRRPGHLDHRRGALRGRRALQRQVHQPPERVPRAREDDDLCLPRHGRDQDHVPYGHHDGPGRGRRAGHAEQVADEYLKRAHARGNERLSTLNRSQSEYPRWGSGEIETLEIDLFGDGNDPTLVFKPGEPFRVRVRYKVHHDCQDPVFGIGMYRSDGTYVNGSNHMWRDDPIEFGSVKAGDEGEVEMDFNRLPLLKGQYYLTTFLYDHSKVAPTAIDHREHATTFEVLDANHHQHGMLYLPMRWTSRRRSASGGEQVEVSES